MANVKIEKNDLKKCFWRNLFGLQMGWNYEKMQGLGYCYAIMPALRKLYQGEALHNAVKTHLGFFNTTPAMSNLILGANIALEEQIGHDAEGVAGVKAGLMGPFAGVGDVAFVAIYRAIVFSIAAYLALQGSVIGLVIMMACGVAIWWVRYQFTLIGYNQGTKIAAGMGNALKNLTEAASILGLVVIGAMAPSVISARLTHLSYSLSFADMDLGTEEAAAVTRNIQTDFLDIIMPGIWPLAIVLFAFWLLGKKWMNTTRLILALFILGFFIGNLHTMLGMS